MSLRMRLHVIRDVLSGLHAAHQLRDQRGRCLNVVHAGVRPSNVIVSYDGAVKVVGLGLARALTWRGEKSDIPSRLRYLAPEQLLEQEVDRRADVFSVGIMLWESISLRKFTSSSIRERDVIQRRLSGAEPRIAQVSPQVPLPLARLCDKAMSVERKQRFASAREFQEALDEYMSSSGAPCKVTSLGQLVAKKFEGERSEVNRLINRGRRGGMEISTAVAMRLPRPLDDDGEPTIVRDATSLLEHSHVTGPITVLVPSRAQWRWFAPTVALLLLLVVVLWFG
jgi:serine/threonine protein kinase